MLYIAGIVSVLVCSLYCRKCIQDWEKIIESKQGEQIINNKKAELILYFSVVVSVCIFVFLFHKYGYGPLKCIKYCCLLWGLVPIAYRDWKTQIIPNRWLLYLVIIRIVIFIIECIAYPEAIMDSVAFILLGTLISGAVMFIAYVISRHEIGMGDVKLFIVMGMYLGLSLNYVVLLMSLILSAVYGGIKLLKKDLKAKDAIPFGPFVLMGTVLVLGLGF